MSNPLLPCPFCNHQTPWIEDIYEDEERRYYVFCNSCRAMGARKHDIYEAVDAWNTRAERTCKIDEYATGEKAEYDTEEIICNCGDCHTEYGVTAYSEDGDVNMVVPSFCPNCGAKAVRV